MILINEKTKDKMYVNSSKINEIKFFEKSIFYSAFITRNIIFSLDNGYRFEIFPVEIDILRKLGLEEISKHRFDILKIVDEIESEIENVFNAMVIGDVIKLDYLRFKRCL